MAAPEIAINDNTASRMRVDRLLHFARKMTLEGRCPLAMEALGMATQCDIAQGINVMDSLENVAIVAGHYREMCSVTKEWTSIPPHPKLPPGKRIRLAYVVPGIVGGNAQTRRVQGLVQHRDRDRYDVRVYSTEDFSVRPYPLLWLFQSLAGSAVRGEEVLKEMYEDKVKTYIAPVEGTLLDTAYEVAHAITDFRPHVVLYQGSIAAPILCILAGWHLAPVQVSFNTGVPMYMPHIDLTLYASAAKLQQEAQSWNPNRGGLALMPPAVSIPPPAGSELQNNDLPPRRAGGTVCITVSNHPQVRLSKEFVQTLIPVLKANPLVEYWVMGSGDCTQQLADFEAAGVAHQVAFLGGRNDIWPGLRKADIYLNEFPIGGAQSVMEAMACGLPIVAGVYSGKHQHNCGAGYIGPTAIHPFSTAAYADRMTKLIQDEDYRKTEGAAMWERVDKFFRYDIVTKQYEQLYESLLADKAAGHGQSK